MHFSGANMAALFTDLWCGKMKNYAPDDRATWDWAVLVNDVWEEHGAAVAACRPYLPGSFDNPPRNPAEKMNTHYKAREYITWLFGLAPALLYGILPHKYWLNFCKFTQALRIMSQYSINSAQLMDAFIKFAEWEGEFEEIYYQRLAHRLHFIRPCVHLSNHLALKASRVGSPICSSQWTMERTFADVEFDLRQPKLPYACLTQVCSLRCQTNAIKSMFPHFDPPDVLAPRYSLDIGNGYVLLRARDKRSRCAASPAEAAAMADFLGHEAPKFFRWARLHLPNGQISRSAWKEKDRPVEHSRSARNIKAKWHFKNVAIVSLYSPPDAALLELSFGTVWSCKHQGDRGLHVVEIEQIQAVVAVIPHRPTLPSGVTEDRFFVVERTGLDVSMTGVFLEENDDNVDSDEEEG
ncbi:uncharacterized protein BJ212DRAFT_1292067 [Suillus subaureus]|uniref:Uncharacterized protein n=1 Tax=Suillus subaureus TaxID=48587 RepID=A0A9P7AQC4_9AGAM|nr:uncharacterized protein BJ212DRAFT_1292067 [Suillus subaureus]KAG1794298.1 hypothetical protein BJ212DRAFT_1292067 [Suillus subaureus]